jgi:hypothetical protein
MAVKKKMADGGMMEHGGMMSKGGMVVTSIKDIPNFKERLEQGKITYRGLGLGKLNDRFYDIAGQSGTRIKVDGKEYYITSEEFNTFSRDSNGKMRIRFDAPARKGYADGGMMADGGVEDSGIVAKYAEIGYNIQYILKKGVLYQVENGDTTEISRDLKSKEEAVSYLKKLAKKEGWWFGRKMKYYSKEMAKGGSVSKNIPYKVGDVIGPVSGQNKYLVVEFSGKNTIMKDSQHNTKIPVPTSGLTNSFEKKMWKVFPI